MTGAGGEGRVPLEADGRGAGASWEVTEGAEDLLGSGGVPPRSDGGEVLLEVIAGRRR